MLVCKNCNTLIPNRQEIRIDVNTRIVPLDVNRRWEEFSGFFYLCLKCLDTTEQGITALIKKHGTVWKA